MLKRLVTKFVLLSVPVGLAVAAIWFLITSNRPNLVELQKQYVFARSDEKRNEVIDKVEAHYLGMSVPDSIRQRVNATVQAWIDSLKIDPPDSPDVSETDNPYELENRLQEWLRHAMILCARAGAQDTFSEFMHKARQLAVEVDAETSKAYWVPFVERLDRFTSNEANAWLRAKQSAILFKKTFNSNHEEAWAYGAYGLQNLEVAMDERLRLELLQRFQVALYLHHSLTDLSLGLADRLLQRAQAIQDHLRATAITYYMGEALLSSGQNEQGLQAMQQVLLNIARYSNVPLIFWFRPHALIQSAVTYWQSGRFDEALAICEQLQTLELNSNQQMTLHNIRGLVFNSLGKYDSAEVEYKIAIEQAQAAEFVFNESLFLHNLGHMYYELTEYDKALEYYSIEQTRLARFLPDNYQRRTNLCIDMAKVVAAQDRFSALDSLINEASDLIANLGDLPLRKADFLISLGSFKLELGRTAEALKDFQQGEVVCNANGLIRVGLRAKVGAAETLMHLGKLSEARQKLRETLTIAEETDEVEKIIDSLALLAEIENRLGNFDDAVALSNRLSKRIENLSAQFENSQRLAAYRQKIYDYLKRAVSYEIQLNRIDSALVKLDYAKARSLKLPNGHANGTTYANGKINLHLDVNRLRRELPPGAILLDYFVTKDSLFVFVLRNDTLQLFSRPIDHSQLSQEVTRYTELIVQTPESFLNYRPTRITRHFRETSRLSHQLFTVLFGWPELQDLIAGSDLMYVVPDEFLHELPFSTLVVDTTAEVRYLISEGAVANLPGASLLFPGATPNTTASSTNLRLLISADPNLSGVKELILHVQRLFPLAEELQFDRLPGKDDVLKRLSRGYDALIIIGHGVANSKYPEQSFIEFTVQDTVFSRTETIQISVADLKRINWPAPELVLLVGCETGTGKLYRGTGIYGLQQSFIQLGARNVTASLWKIDAGEAIPQVEKFITVWAKGIRPFEALQTTQLNSIEQLTKNEYYVSSHPYFWASLNLMSRN